MQAIYRILVKTKSLQSIQSLDLIYSDTRSYLLLVMNTYIKTSFSGSFSSII